MKILTPYLTRYVEAALRADLDRKMVFLTGPRQSGKTRLARHLLEESCSEPKQWYLNWDAADDREHILRERFPSGQGLIVLDEIHKYSRWRQVVKGLFDKRGHELRILVTGSARLDYYRKGGDSLQGRYHLYRLHPLSLAEIQGKTGKDMHDLLRYGGFPEPFLAASETETRRWSREYQSRVIREDLRDLTNVRDVGLIERLALRLPELVGSPLSLNALREDLQVAHQTIARWVEALERLYVLFRIYPFGGPRIRAVKKEAKHYHYDWTLVGNIGLRFENLVACHLLKMCHFHEDKDGRQLELRYFRDVDRREVDFVVMEDGRPRQFVECKVSEKEVAPALKYLKQRFPAVEAVQVVLNAGEDMTTRDGIRVCPAEVFLSSLV